MHKYLPDEKLSILIDLAAMVGCNTAAALDAQITIRDEEDLRVVRHDDRLAVDLDRAFGNDRDLRWTRLEPHVPVNFGIPFDVVGSRRWRDVLARPFVAVELPPVARVFRRRAQHGPGQIGHRSR